MRRGSGRARRTGPRPWRRHLAGDARRSGPATTAYRVLPGDDAVEVRAGRARDWAWRPRRACSGPPTTPPASSPGTRWPRPGAGTRLAGCQVAPRPRRDSYQPSSSRRSPAGSPRGPSAPSSRSTASRPLRRPPARRAVGPAVAAHLGHRALGRRAGVNLSRSGTVVSHPLRRPPRGARQPAAGRGGDPAAVAAQGSSAGRLRRSASAPSATRTRCPSATTTSRPSSGSDAGGGEGRRRRDARAARALPRASLPRRPDDRAVVRRERHGPRYEGRDYRAM